MYTTIVDRPLRTISLRSWRSGTAHERAAAAAAVDAAGVDPGVFILADTGLDDTLLDDLIKSTRAFFALPEAQKRAALDPVDQFVGYRGPDGNRNEYGSPELKEMYHVGPRHAPTLSADPGRPIPDPAEAMANCTLWPRSLPDFVLAWHNYYQAMQQIALDLLRLFAEALDVPASDLLVLASRNASDLAANFYPVPADGQTGRIRNAPHADQTLFTVLYQDGDDDGLLIEWADGAWTPVAAGGATLLVNFGQLFALLSADRWRAVPHQVVPAVPDGSSRARVTLPFFFRPHAGTELVALPRFRTPQSEPPVLMSEWLATRRARISAPIITPSANLEEDS